MTPARLGLAAALLLTVAAPAAAQSSGQPFGQPYGQTYGQPSRYPPAGYDARGGSQPAYDAYDRSRPNGYAPQRDDRYDTRDAPTAGSDRGADQGSAPDLGRDLNLRGDQRAALDAYKAAFRPDEAAARAAEDVARRLPTMTTPQRLDFTRREMDRERADFERTDAATRRFYAQLTPEQRRSFDRLTAPQDEGGDDEAPTAGDPAGRRN